MHCCHPPARYLQSGSGYPVVVFYPDSTKTGFYKKTRIKKTGISIPFFLQAPKNGGSGRKRQIAFPLPI
jgi:hypothetical protein